MGKALFITDGRFPGNTMRDPDETSHNEQIINVDIKSLQSFCDKMEGALEQLQDASNFKEQIEKIAPQLESNNFAKIEFTYPSARYRLAIVPPKFTE